MRLFHQIFRHAALDARQRDIQLHFDAEAVRDLTDADGAVDLGFGRDLTFSFAATNFNAPRKQAE